MLLRNPTILGKEETLLLLIRKMGTLLISKIPPLPPTLEPPVFHFTQLFERATTQFLLGIPK